MSDQRMNIHSIYGHDISDISNSNCDSIRLQSLINKSNPGDIIELEGTFDFGINQFISLKKDLSLKGIRGSKGEFLTRIKGGMNTFALGWDPSQGITKFNKKNELISNNNNQRWQGNYSIQDISFERPTWSAIMVAASSGLEICNNKFLGGNQFDTGCNAYGFDPPDGSMSAIMISSGRDARQPVIGSPEDITDCIHIDGNEFIGELRYDSNGFDPVHGASSMIHGKDRRLNGIISPIYISETKSSITVQNNIFFSITWGLFLLNNSGTQIIRNNLIRMDCKDDQDKPIGFSWAGISVQNYGDNYNNSEVVIEKNELIINVADFFSGILLSSKSGVIRENIIELDQTQESLWNIYGDAAGIRLYRRSENNIIERNIIKGLCQTGIVLQEGMSETDICSNNIVRDNDLSEFTPTEIKDIWARLEGKTNCPILPGSFYHLSNRTMNNEIILINTEKDTLIIDDTSEFNPYNPETYNGKNKIRTN